MWHNGFTFRGTVDPTGRTWPRLVRPAPTHDPSVAPVIGCRVAAGSGDVGSSGEGSCSMETSVREMPGGVETIGSLIRRARQSAGKSQTALAEELRLRSGNISVTREYVSRWESGRRIPTPFWRQHIASVLALPRDQVDRACAVSIHRRERLT
jgi:hypothetical protein